MRKQRLLTVVFIISLMVSSSISGETSDDTIKSIVTVVDSEGHKTKYVNTIQTINNEQDNFMKPSSPWSGYLTLDGNDDYAQAEDHPELDVGDESTENLTIEAWINFTQFSSSNVVEKRNAYDLYTVYSSSMGYTFKGVGIWLNPIGMVEVATTQYGGGGFWEPGWHHIAGVYNQTSGELMICMDGEQLHSWVSGGGLVTNTIEPLQVGIDVAGQIDEVRISNNIRYPDTSYSVPSLPYENDEYTRALWHFDESEGATQCHDSSGEDNLLICHNGAHVDIFVSVNYSNYEIPEDYQLHQNYPNPFNPSTTIEFDLPKTSEASLKIFNILGEDVDTLVSDKLSAGSYSYEWDASNLPSGVFLYRLEAEGFVEIKKMILLR